MVGTKDQIYDIDFWGNDKDGTLSVEQTKVHKVPELKDGQYVQVPCFEVEGRRAAHVVLVAPGSHFRGPARSGSHEPPQRAEPQNESAPRHPTGSVGTPGETKG